MSKWISDDSVICREIHTTHGEGHNTLGSNPVFKARLEIPWSQLKLAISKLLGNPEPWPHDTIMQNVVAINAEVISDSGDYGTDDDGQKIDYNYNALVDVTYLPRTGLYLEDYNEQDVYWDDELEPRYESRPENHTLLIWGGPNDVVPTDKIPLHPDEVPSTYEAGQTLIHTIEGWTLGTDGLTDLIGKTNLDAYESPILHQTFAAGTLLLRNYIVTRSFTFRSYRYPAVPPPEDPDMEFSGKATNNLKLIFEHKRIGWQKFRRVIIDNVGNNTIEYCFIRFNRDPWSKFIPFPLTSMQTILGYTP